MRGKNGIKIGLTCNACIGLCGMTTITDTEISAACAELEDALLTLLAERDNNTHYDAAQDHLNALGQMADALLDAEDDADLGGPYGMPAHNA